MMDHLDGRIITSIGKQVWNDVSRWLYGKSQKPRFSSAYRRRVLSGNDQLAGLRYKDGCIIHSNQAINTAQRKSEGLGNKAIKMRASWSGMSKRRASCYQQAIMDGKIKKVSLVMDEYKTSIQAHLVLDCPVYRHEDKMKKASEAAGKTVSFDLGPSSLAYVSPDNVEQGVIQPSAKLLRQVKNERHNRKRLQRKLQRSRQATNPDCYQEDGQYIPGKKIENKSKSYKRTQARVRQSYQDEQKLIHAWHNNAVDKIISLGLNIITEKDTIKDWQEKGYGKSINLLAPATLKQKILHESRVFGGQQTELNTYFTWLSQSCICGQRVKKELYQRVHLCQNTDCLLHGIPLHRDKFAALLGLWVKELGTTSKKNSKTKKIELVFNEKLGVKRLLAKNYHTNEHRIIAIELCSVGSLDHNLEKSKDENPEEYQDSMASNGDLEKTEGTEEAYANKPLSKPDCLGSLNNETDQSGRAITSNPAYIHGNNNNQHIIPPPEQSSGKKCI
jgi:hypothetical protein